MSDKFDVLTTVGPGTPTGEFFRQFWLPVAKSAEFEAGGDPIRLLALGERLIGFRDTEGRMGIMDHRCPHRGASLFFGRNEDGGLRCSYHGFKFDVAGRCNDMPSVAVNAHPERLTARAYRVCERNGLVWLYMGSRPTPPPLPVIGVVDDSDAELEIQMFLRECNWLQGMEGDIDAAHLAWLHHGGHDPEKVGDHFTIKWVTSGRTVESKAANTVWGTMEAHHRPDSIDPDYWHYTQQILPSWTIPGQSTFDDEEPVVRFWLPMDDTHAMIFQLSRPQALVDGKSAFHIKMGEVPGALVRMADLLLPNSKDWYGRWRLTPSEENDYFLDRDAQRHGNYTGINGVQIQDKAITESMGPIVDRGYEHLGPTDLMISRTRLRLLKAVEEYAVGGALPATVDDPEITRHVRAGGGHKPADQDWLDYYRERARGVSPRILLNADDGGDREGDGAPWSPTAVGQPS